MFSINNLSFQKNKNLLLNNLSFSFDEGSLISVLGPNGAGKTTLFRTLSGIYKPSFGSIFWKNKNCLNLTTQEKSQIFGYVPSTSSVLFPFSVLEVVTMGLYSEKKHFLETFTADDRVENVISLLNLNDLRNKSLTTLSQGQKKRVILATTLVRNPPILFLDEPFSDLDISHQMILWSFLQKLQKAGKIIFVSLHDLFSAKKFCEKAMVLHKGNLISYGFFSSAVTEKVIQEIFSLPLTAHALF